MFRRVEKLRISQVRQLCMDYNFYTKGDCEQYQAMFNECELYNGDTEHLSFIALDIVTHTDDYELEDYGLESLQDKVAFVMSLLLRNCLYVEVKVER